MLFPNDEAFDRRAYEASGARFAMYLFFILSHECVLQLLLNQVAFNAR